MFIWPLFPEHMGGQAKTVASHCLPEGVIRIAYLSKQMEVQQQTGKEQMC